MVTTKHFVIPEPVVVRYPWSAYLARPGYEEQPRRDVCYHALMKSRILFAAPAASLSLVLSAPAFAQPDVAAGKIVFNQKCANCHTLAADPAHGPKGPNLMGVIGRTAGSIAGWDFSPALRASGLEFHPRGKQFLIWTEENLDKWLTDAGIFVPGSRMHPKMPNRTEREYVVAYMKNLSATTK